MKLTAVRSKCSSIKFNTANEEAVINTTSYTGPEFVLEDGSVILCDSMNTYFDVITNADIFIIAEEEKNNEIDIDYLESKNLVFDYDVPDGVRYKNKHIIEVHAYSLTNGICMYRFLFQEN